MASTTQKMNSDELGALAASSFETLANSARFVVNNSSSRDRTGWDFRVEFPTSDLDEVVAIDKRKVPPPIMVQVKGVMAGSKTIKLNLKTLERLARLTEPSVICILEFDDPDTIDAVYYIHLVRDALSVVLKRLTKINVEGDNKLSGRETLSFSKVKYWKHFPNNAEGIRQAFTKLVLDGKTADQYATEKQKQLNELGYEIGAYTGELTILASDQEELSDGLLGLKPLNLTKFDMFEERFGYKRQHFSLPSEGGTVEISPADSKEVLIQFSVKGREEPIARKGSLITPAVPPPSLEELRFLIKSDPLTIDIKPGGSFNLTAGGFDQLEIGCDEWVEVCAILDGVCRSGFSMKLKTTDFKPIWSARINDTPNMSSDDKSANRWILNEWQYLEKILSKCGCKNLPLTLDGMTAASKDIQSCYATLFTDEPNLSFTLDSDVIETHLDTTEPIEGWLGNAFRVGKYCIAYVCRVSLNYSKSTGKPQLSGVVIGKGHAEVVDPEQYDDFVKRTVKVEKSDLLLILPLDKDDFPVDLNYGD